MQRNDKIQNILAFLTVLFGENSELCKAIMDFSPDYLIEKYERYIESTQIEHHAGIHPGLRHHLFNPYLRKWFLPEIE